MAERGGGEEVTGIIPFQEYAAAAATDFGIVDFMDNDLDQLIQLIQVQNHIFYLDDHHMNTADVVGGQLFPTIQPPAENHDQLFVGFDEAALMSAASGHQVIANNNDIIISPGFSAANDHRQFQNDTVLERDDDDDDVVYGEAESSETATNYSSEKKQKKGDHKSDRTKTLISERRRRGRMKEKLYALRALVPYITKMDKASIVGDAVLYVQDLQMQAKKLKSEISGLESSLLTGGVSNSNNNNNKHQGRDIVHNSNKTNATTFHPTIKKIIKMDVFQVEDRGFYVRVVLKKGKGVAVLIYRALESVTTFDVRSSNLAAHSDNYVFTFTLHIREGDHQVDMNLACLKMWVASVFLSQGFEFETLPSA